MRTKESAKRHDGRHFRRFKLGKRPAVPLSLRRESHSDGCDPFRVERIEADEGNPSAQGNKGEAAAVTEEMD